MGAWRIQADFHDDQIHEFVVTTLDEDWTEMDPDELRIFQTTARYIAQRMVDEAPGLLEAARKEVPR